MTRGKIIYVAKDLQVYSTVEFNGDMYPFDGGHGEEIIDYFHQTGFKDVCSYERFVRRLDDRHFGYSAVRGDELIHFRGLYREDMFDFTENWTDYLYLVNQSGAEIQIMLEEGKKAVPQGALAIVRFQNLREVIPGSNGFFRIGEPEQTELEKLMANMDWKLFVKQKEWLDAQQTQTEKWYGEGASALPAGILNMMDRIQDAWEKEIDCADINGCWYEERWYDEDLRSALIEAGVDATAKNVMKLRDRCLHIFDDKSGRNEMLADAAREMMNNT